MDETTSRQDSRAVKLANGDALIIVDIQNDFLPGGALGIRNGDEVIPVINAYLRLFSRRGLPIYFTRDWHPPDHCSFPEQGGPWPVHCVAGTHGAAFADSLQMPPDATIVSKATSPGKEAYSTFEGTDLGEQLRQRSVRRVFIGGLATDYCVVNSVRDAHRLGLTIFVLEDAIRAVDVHPGDGEAACETMRQHGARFLRLRDLEEAQA
jgi:nicotinamidase/pyrazinamidase